MISRAIAKSPDERYQRGAEFAEDLRLLQQNYKPGSTTTSLQAIVATGTRSAAHGTGRSSVSGAKSIAEAEQLVRDVLLKAPVRDLILGAAVVVLLVVLVAQSKLLIIAPKLGFSVPGNAPQTVPEATANVSSQPSQTTPTSTLATTPTPKAHAAHPHPPKQIVVAYSTLDLAIRHQFKEATLSLWVDNKLTRTRPLHGGVQKKLVVFNGVKGVESETLQIPAGTHVLRLRVVSSDQTTDLSKTVSAEFVGGGEKSLQVTFDKHNTVMRLTWQ